jgi:hypothetical protein
VDVDSGGNYCIRLSGKHVTPIFVIPVALIDSKIEQVSCRQAVEEAGSYKPIDLKRVEPAAQAKLDTSPTFARDN